MRIPLSIGIAALFVTFAPQVVGSECEMTTSDTTLDTGDVGGTRLYVVNDFIPGTHAEFLVSVWVYEESNGVDGLQRHDGFKDDTCGGQFEGDATRA